MAKKLGCHEKSLEPRFCVPCKCKKPTGESADYLKPADYCEANLPDYCSCDGRLVSFYRCPLKCQDQGALAMVDAFFALERTKLWPAQGGYYQQSARFMRWLPLLTEYHEERIEEERERIKKETRKE